MSTPSCKGLLKSTSIAMTSLERCGGWNFNGGK